MNFFVLLWHNYSEQSHKKICVTVGIYYVIHCSIRAADPDTLFVLYIWEAMVSTKDRKI